MNSPSLLVKLAGLNILVRDTLLQYALERLWEFSSKSVNPALNKGRGIAPSNWQSIRRGSFGQAKPLATSERVDLFTAPPERQDLLVCRRLNKGSKASVKYYLLSLVLFYKNPSSEASFGLESPLKTGLLPLSLWLAYLSMLSTNLTLWSESG